MFNREKILYEGDTEFAHYQVIEMVYEGRKARVLFTGKRDAAFSGIPLDDQHHLLFDYIQRFYELTCQTRPRNLLMIGGGTYTLPTALLYALPDITIDAVEIDPGLDRIAEAYFGLTPNPRLNIIHGDGVDYIRTNRKKYDMIIIDAFDDLKIPENFAKDETAAAISASLSSKGILAMNVISSYYGRNAAAIEGLQDEYDPHFKHLGVYPADTGTSLWMSQNLLLVGQKSGKKKEYGLRFGELGLSNLIK